MRCEKIAKMEALNCLIYPMHWFQRVTRFHLIHVQSVAGSVKPALSKKFSKGHAQFSKSTQACLSNGLHSADKIKFSLHLSRAVNKRVDKGRYSQYSKSKREAKTLK